jgi:hypothetical protein
MPTPRKKRKRKRAGKSKVPPRSAYSPKHQRQMAKWRIQGLLANGQQILDRFSPHMHKGEAQDLGMALIDLIHCIDHWGKR